MEEYGNIGIPKQERSGLKEKSKLEITNETYRSSFSFRVTYGQELQKEVIEIQPQDSVRTEILRKPETQNYAYGNLQKR